MKHINLLQHDNAPTLVAPETVELLCQQPLCDTWSQQISGQQKHGPQPSALQNLGLNVMLQRVYETDQRPTKRLKQTLHDFEQSVFTAATAVAETVYTRTCCEKMFIYMIQQKI